MALIFFCGSSSAEKWWILFGIPADVDYDGHRAMIFHIEERQAWLRPQTHTCILDREPDFALFSEDPSGETIRLLRIWLAEPSPKGLLRKAYVGCLLVGSWGVPKEELLLLFRRVTDLAPTAGESGKDLRHRLARAIRRHLRRKAVPRGSYR